MGRDYCGDTTARCCGEQRLAFTMGDLDPIFDDRAQFAIDGDLVLPMAAGSDEAGALSDESAVLVGPLDDLPESGGVVHDRLSEIASRTTRS
jgi:hypothetical protein